MFGKFSSGLEWDKGVWDHAYVTVVEMTANLDEEVVDDALDAYDDLMTSWRGRGVQLARDAQEV